MRPVLHSFVNSKYGQKQSNPALTQMYQDDYLRLSILSCYSNVFHQMQMLLIFQYLIIITIWEIKKAIWQYMSKAI